MLGLSHSRSTATCMPLSHQVLLLPPELTNTCLGLGVNTLPATFDYTRFPITCPLTNVPAQVFSGKRRAVTSRLCRHTTQCCCRSAGPSPRPRGSPLPIKPASVQELKC